MTKKRLIIMISITFWGAFATMLVLFAANQFARIPNYRWWDILLLSTFINLISSIFLFGVPFFVKRIQKFDITEFKIGFGAGITTGFLGGINNITQYGFGLLGEVVFGIIIGYIMSCMFIMAIKGIDDGGGIGLHIGIGCGIGLGIGLIHGFGIGLIVGLGLLTFFGLIIKMAFIQKKILIN